MIFWRIKTPAPSLKAGFISDLVGVGNRVGIQVGIGVGIVRALLI